MSAPVWQVMVDSSTPSEWSEMLDLFNDANIYQTWSYGLVRWGAKNLSHLIVKRNGEVVGMAQVRIIRPTRFKFGMAYLRWGPVCERLGSPLDPEVLAHICRALEEEYVEKRRLLLNVLPNAFFGSPRGDLFEAAFARFERKQLTSNDAYRTFVLDVARPLDELRKKLDPKWRNKLTQAEKKGLKIIAGSDPGMYRTFCGTYYEMRKRKTFDTTVDVEEFARIQIDLPESHRMQVLICEQEQKPIAAIVCSALGDSAIYLLGATTDSGLNSRGAYLLQWTAIQWLKDRGVRWYDLGGIDPVGNPGVYSFKKGLSGVDVSQLCPLVACTSAVSAAAVSISLAVRRSLRSGVDALQGVRPLRELVVKS
jgi:lipid II:glycine glycyltransferase (peptidoglycan interpeptide bridge formation enzyme)